MESEATISTPENASVTAELIAARVRLEELELANETLILERDSWRERAIRDRTTGLLSREGLDHELESVDLSKVSVIFLDLDNFKKVNDNFGHIRGDEALAEIGQVLKSSVRPGDVVARIGGDEFIIFAPHVTRGDDSHKTPEEQRDALCQRIDESMQHLLSTSPDLKSVNLGITSGSAIGHENATVKDLLSEADQSMYSSKTRRD